MSILSRRYSRGGTKGTVLGLAAFFGVIFLLGLSCGPFFGSKKIAQKSAAANSVGQIAKCYYAYCFPAGGARVATSAQAGPDLNAFALFLARDAGMNVPDLWFVKRDQALEHVDLWPLRVADLSDPKHAVIDPGFAKTRPKSFAVVIDMPDPKTLEAHATTYPVAWTRGLGAKGWKANSPWGGDGGHVAYLDGHTTWYDATTDENGVGVFKDYLTGEPTSDIRKAIGPGAKILEDE